MYNSGSFFNFKKKILKSKFIFVNKKLKNKKKKELNTFI